jgi:hypothetical protein
LKDKRRFPKLLWPLDIQNTDQGGEQYLLLRDVRGLAPEAILVPRAFAVVLSLLDGASEIDEILRKTSAYGLTPELLDMLLSELSKRGFLEDEKTELRWKEIQGDYESLRVRPAAHAGLVYSGDKDSLEREITDYLKKVETSPLRSGDLIGVMCPHIDYRRGWQTYAATYRVLEKAIRPDVIFLLGTSHQFSEELFHLTKHDFSTPLGRVPTALSIVNSIANRYGEKSCLGNQILHKTEHSLELQLPFLQMCYRDQMPEIVPILVGSFHGYFARNLEPKEDPRVGDFIEALVDSARELQAEGKRCIFYAGVDLAHVGRYFGDPNAFDTRALAAVEERDHLLIETLRACDPLALYEHMAEDSDARRVCGYPSLYTTMAVLRGLGLQAEGQNIEYRQAVDSSQDCHVSFGSFAWYHANS